MTVVNPNTAKPGVIQQLPPLGHLSPSLGLGACGMPGYNFFPIIVIKSGSY